GRTDRVDVALIKLAEPSTLRPVGAPDRLNLIALEKPGQLVLILGDDPGQRHGEVVAQREVGRAGRLMVTPPQDLEKELVAFLPVLPEQRLDVLEGRRLEWLEPVALVDLADDADDILPSADLLGQKIPRTARRLSRHQLWLEGGWARTLPRARGEAFLIIIAGGRNVLAGFRLWTLGFRCGGCLQADLEGRLKPAPTIECASLRSASGPAATSGLGRRGTSTSGRGSP